MPLDDNERKSMICLCMLIELQNAASMDEMTTFFTRAQAREFEHKPLVKNQSEIVKQLMRHETDSSAVHYALAIEHQEFKNTQMILKIIEELKKKEIVCISDEHRDELLWDSFEEYLETQIENNHTQQYLDMYDRSCH